MEYRKIINTILILDDKVVDEKDRKMIDSAKKRLNMIMIGGVISAVGGSLLYSRMAKRFFSKYRLGFDIAYILGFTSIISYAHLRSVKSIDLDKVRRKYRYVLSNSVIMKDYIKNNFHSLNVSHFYLTLLLILRTIV